MAEKKTSRATRPANLPHGRWLSDLEPPKLRAAEKELLESCANGNPWKPKRWDDKRPKKATNANRIRACLIRFLLLGGDDNNPVHEKGVYLEGAWVEGELNLEEIESPYQLSMYDCYFDEAIEMSDARLSGLILSRCRIPELTAQRARLAGNALLEGTICEGMMSFAAASIEGQLDLDGARLINPPIQDNSQRPQTSNAKKSGKALIAQSLTVKNQMFFRPKEIQGTVRFTNATIDVLIDSKNELFSDCKTCWPDYQYYLDGLVYKRLPRGVKVKRRIEWLNKQHPEQLGDNFAPQPWEQLAKVLRENGHNAKAAEVAIAKQNELARTERYRQFPLRQLHATYGALAGYGYRPLALVGWMVTIWLFTSLYYAVGAHAGYFAPTDPVLSSPDLAPTLAAQCGPPVEYGDASGSGKSYWTECDAMPSEYSIFQPLIYSLDVILPLVDLQQEVDWAPVVEDAQGNTLVIGYVLRWIMWLEILFGWAASLMLVAILGRLVEKD